MVESREAISFMGKQRSSTARRNYRDRLMLKVIPERPLRPQSSRHPWAGLRLPFLAACLSRRFLAISFGEFTGPLCVKPAQHRLHREWRQVLVWRATIKRNVFECSVWHVGIRSWSTSASQMRIFAKDRSPFGSPPMKTPAPARFFEISRVPSITLGSGGI